MPVETPVTFINTLNSANPLDTDFASDGDNHIRNIKAAIKATFPNITSAVAATGVELSKLAGVTATPAELNKLAGVTATSADLNKLAASTFSVAELNRITGVTSPIQTQLNAKQALDPTLTGLAALNATVGLLVQSAVDTYIKRVLAGTANQIAIANPDGVSGNPTISAVIATALEAAAGADNDKLLTSLRVRDAITAALSGAAGQPRVALPAFQNIVAGTVIKSRVDAEISSGGQNAQTIGHSFAFLQSGTVRVTYEQYTRNGGGRVDVKKISNGVTTVVETNAGTNAWVAQTVDVTVLAGDQIEIWIIDGNVSYDSQARIMRFRTTGADLIPGKPGPLEP